jgi:hypothetical protein
MAYTPKEHRAAIDRLMADLNLVVLDPLDGDDRGSVRDEVVKRMLAAADNGAPRAYGPVGPAPDDQAPDDQAPKD